MFDPARFGAGGPGSPARRIGLRSHQSPSTPTRSHCRAAKHPGRRHAGGSRSTPPLPGPREPMRFATRRKLSSAAGSRRGGLLRTSRCSDGSPGAALRPPGRFLVASSPASGCEKLELAAIAQEPPFAGSACERRPGPRRDGGEMAGACPAGTARPPRTGYDRAAGVEGRSRGDRDVQAACRGAAKACWRRRWRRLKTRLGSRTLGPNENGLPKEAILDLGCGDRI